MGLHHIPGFACANNGLLPLMNASALTAFCTDTTRYRNRMYVAKTDWASHPAPPRPSGEGLTWHLYPNPATDWVFLTPSAQPETPEAARLTLRDLAGRTVQAADTPPDDQGRYRLDTSALAPGAYLLEMQTGSQPPRTFKLVRP